MVIRAMIKNAARIRRRRHQPTHPRPHQHQPTHPHQPTRPGPGRDLRIRRPTRPGRPAHPGRPTQRRRCQPARLMPTSTASPSRPARPCQRQPARPCQSRQRRQDQARPASLRMPPRRRNCANPARGFSIISSGQTVYRRGHICLHSKSWRRRIRWFRPWLNCTAGRIPCQASRFRSTICPMKR